MNLHGLHTPQPLRDADFAAIRARVKAEIAQREEKPWLAMLLRFAFAAALVVAIVPFVRERAPEVVAVKRAPISVEREQVASANPEPPPQRAADDGQRKRSERRAEARPTSSIAASRIEIITADPTIRIIWLTPKENS